MTAASPRVVLAASSKELSRWVLVRRSHHPTVAVLRSSAHRNEKGRIAAEVLVGMGKRSDLTTLKHRAEHVASAWLANGEATDVLVLEAQQFGATDLGELVEWLCGLGVRPWLIFGASETEGRSANTAKVAERTADELGVKVLDEAKLRAAFPNVRRRKTAPVGAGSGLPVLPRCDGIVFRAACRDLLEPTDFRRVDGEFVACVRRFREAADKVAEVKNRNRYPAYVSGVIRSDLEAASDVDELLLRARAAQVAWLPKFWLVKVETLRLLAAGELYPRNGAADTPELWERLSQYRDPDVGAAVALHLAGFRWEDISELNVTDVVQRKGVVKVNKVEIPEPGAKYLRVLLTYRQLIGAETPELFTNHRASDPRAKPVQIRKLLNDVSAEQGVRVADIKQGKKPNSDTEWLARFGISVTNLRLGRPSKETVSVS